MNRIYELKNKRAGLLAEAKTAVDVKDMETYNAKMSEVTKLNEEISALENLAAEEGRFDETDPTMAALNLAGQKRKEDTEKRGRLDAARGGNDYANAWAKAIRGKVNIDAGMADEALKPLYNAMTIGGGTPEGSDGGFLVPIEFDNMIHLKMKEFVRLADYFTVENVTGYTGWRAVETTAGRTTLPKIEEATPIPANGKPTFKKVTYTVSKFGDRIPVSNELISDNTAGLMQYLANWFGPRVVLTENDLLLALFRKLTARTLAAGKEVAELKATLNKALNTAISRSAILLGNQSSYDFLDQLTDTNGRGLLTPNPADPDVMRFKNRPVIMADDDLIPNRTVTTAGATKGDYYPLYVGNLKAFGTLFRRQALEFAATNIGGDAWANATTEVRGIVRMDAQPVDEDAAVLREIFIPAT